MLSATGVATGLAALPLGGRTVLLVAVGLTLVSTHRVARGMDAVAVAVDADACRVDP